MPRLTGASTYGDAVMRDGEAGARDIPQVETATVVDLRLAARVRRCEAADRESLPVRAERHRRRRGASRRGLQVVLPQALISYRASPVPALTVDTSDGCRPGLDGTIAFAAEGPGSTEFRSENRLSLPSAFP